MSRGVDLTRAREDVGYFAQCAGWPVTPTQLDAIDLRTLVTAILAPRQTGKSHALALKSVHWATAKRDQYVLVISGGDTAALRLMDAIRSLVRKSPLLTDSVVRDTVRKIELSNGSVIECVPTSGYQVRSATVDLLIFDEAGLISASIVAAAEPTLAARQGRRIIYAGTPWMLDSPFHRVVQAGDRGSEHARTVRWSLKDAPAVNWELVEYHRETMAESTFRAEYEGVWGGESDSLFSRELIEFASADYQTLGLSDLVSDVALLGGVDWGRRHDQTAVVAIGRLPLARLNPEHSGPVFGVVGVHVWPRDTPTTAAVRDLMGSDAWWRCLSYEDNGIGTGPADSIDEQFAPRNARIRGARGGRWVAPVVPVTRFGGARVPDDGYEWEGPPQLPQSARNRVTTTAGVKADLLGQLKAMMEQRRLVIPREGLLMRQLAGLRVEYRPSGVTSIANDAATQHDDVADAAWLALGPLKNHPARSVANRLLHAPTPDADVPTDGATVTTGGGLLIPRRPRVQCVSTTAVVGMPDARAMPTEDDFIEEARAQVRRVLNERTEAESV